MSVFVHAQGIKLSTQGHSDAFWPKMAKFCPRSYWITPIKDKFRFYWKCKRRQNTRHLIEWSFYSNQVSSIERQISLAFSIIAHDQFSLLETLIASLFRPHNSYCIFVDAKATTEFHNMVKQLVDCYKYQYPQARFKFNF